MNRTYLLGVDGGGTQTTALVADSAGRVLGRGRSGSSNLHAAGEAAALAALEAAITAACRSAGVGVQDLGTACLGLAGAGRPDDQARLSAWAELALPGVAIRLVTDMALVLAAGTPTGWGVGVIAGTGSSIFGRSPDGRTARAGGWGWALGDEGSGFAIGLGALRAIARATDGRGPETALRDVILQRWALTNPEALVATVYRHPFPRIEIASLAAVVEAVAETGDDVARGLLVEAGRELATGVASVVRALALSSPVPLALGGSVLVHGRLAAAALIDSLAEQGVACEPVGRVEEPAVGALSLQFNK